MNIVLGTAVAMPIALAVATLIGAFNGVLVTRFKVQPIVATLITLITVRGIAEVTVNGFQFAFLKCPHCELAQWQCVRLSPQANNSYGCHCRYFYMADALHLI